MKMMSNTSMTSIIGVTFGVEATPPPEPLLIAIELSPHWGRCSSGRDGGVAARRRVELAREARPAELARHTLDEIVDHLLGDVRHLGGEIVDLGLEVVVRPHGRDR